jgi:hypothetical protein
MLKNSITTRMELAESLPHIQGDRVQLQQVILNLMINAIQAMSDLAGGERELHVTTELITSEGVRVGLRDSGPGFSAESLQRLFTPFYTTKPNGMGMGLSICQSIIEETRRTAVAEPDRAPRCSVSVYDPSHLAGQIMIRSMSLFGTSRHFAVLWNLIAIGAPRTLASRSPGRFMGSRPRDFSLHVRLRGFHWIHPGREQRALFGFYFEPPRANGSASSSLRSSEINYFALIATMASPIASRIIAAARLHGCSFRVLSRWLGA